jgi:ankyrin repeat protein
MFLNKDEKESTAWHIAAYIGKIELLHKLWEWVKYVLTPEDLKNMFLAKDEKERTAWHIAAYMGHMEILHILWEWANRY